MEKKEILPFLRDHLFNTSGSKGIICHWNLSQVVRATKTMKACKIGHFISAYIISVWIFFFGLFGNVCLFIFQRTQRVDLSWNPYSEKDFEFFDSSLIDEIRNNSPMTKLFFTLLSLCHTVMPEVKKNGEFCLCVVNFFGGTDNNFQIFFH